MFRVNKALLLCLSVCFELNMFCFSSVFDQADTQTDAEDGIKFMQEMIELAKQRNDESGRNFSSIRKIVRRTRTRVDVAPSTSVLHIFTISGISFDLDTLLTLLYIMLLKHMMLTC